MFSPRPSSSEFLSRRGQGEPKLGILGAGDGCTDEPMTRTPPCTRSASRVPFERRSRFVQVAQNQVAAVLDEPLQAGKEKLHWIAPTEVWTEADAAASGTEVKAYGVSVVGQPGCPGQDAKPVEAVAAAIAVNGKEIPGEVFPQKRSGKELAVQCSPNLRRLDSDSAAVEGKNSGAISAVVEVNDQPRPIATAVGDDSGRGCVLSDGTVSGANQRNGLDRLSPNQAGTAARASGAAGPGPVGNGAWVAAGEEAEKGSKRGCSEANEPSAPKRLKASLLTPAALRSDRDSISVGNGPSTLAIGAGGAFSG